MNKQKGHIVRDILLCEAILRLEFFLFHSHAMNAYIAYIIRKVKNALSIIGCFIIKRKVADKIEP